MNTQDKKYRRQLLQKAAACLVSGLCLPTMDYMLNQSGTALAQGKALPGKFSLFFWGNGISPARWVPGTEGENWQVSHSLRHCEDIKHRINVVSGLNVPTPTSHDAVVAMISGSQGEGTHLVSKHQGPSIDQEIAAIIGLNSPIKSLEIGVSDNLWANGAFVPYNGVSYTSSGQYNAIEYNPGALMKRIFGMSQASETPEEMAQQKNRIMMQKSIIDYSLKEANQLLSILGQTDKLRMQAHMDGLRDIEKKIIAFESSSGSCMIPAEGSMMSMTPESIPERADIMTDLAVKALECGITNVVTLQFSPAAAELELIIEGKKRGPHHATTHIPGKEEDLALIIQEIMKYFAMYLKKMDAVKIGSQSLLDQIVVYGTSELSQPEIHSNKNMPVLIAGGGNGSLIDQSVHLNGNGASTSKALMTVMKASCADMAKAEIGHGTGKTSEVLNELFKNQQG